MPVLSISTNVKRDQIPKTFLAEATEVVAKELGKPASYVAIQVNPDQMMTFGGTDEPCAVIDLRSLGAVGPDKNRKLAPVLSKFIENQLGIKKDRFYINVTDLPAAYCIWDGSTFG